VKHRAPSRPRSEPGQPREGLTQCFDFLTGHDFPNTDRAELVEALPFAFGGGK